MRLHAGNIEVVVRLWRLLVSIGPGEADAGSPAADACRLEDGNVCPGLSQPKGDRCAHHPSADHDHLRHRCLLNFNTDYGTPPCAIARWASAPGEPSGIALLVGLRIWGASSPGRTPLGS